MVVHGSRAYWLALLAVCLLQGVLLVLLGRAVLGELAPWAALLPRSMLAVLRMLLIYHLLFGWMRQHKPDWRLALVLLVLALADTMLDWAARQAFGGVLDSSDTRVNIEGQAMPLHVSSLFWPGSMLICLVQYGGAALVFHAWQGWQVRQALAQAVQQAQLLQLQNQLRPHFIFNALNSIRALMFEDREAAAAMITGLSTLLRSSLQGEQGLTTLADDWALAQHYLHIEAVRLERRLRVQCDITPALAARPLPAFTLLTLCENAIKHGIAPLSEGGSLLIRAQESTDGWQLQVCNPCTSARPEGLSLGLANLRERLRLLQPDARIEAGRDGDQYRVCLSFTGAKHAHHAGG